MKYFPPEKNSIWSDKVNFVDESNVMLGYDFASQCCEIYGWFINDDPDIDLTIKIEELKHNKIGIVNDSTDKKQVEDLICDYFFSRTYFKEIKFTIGYEEMNRAVFKIINLKGGNLYLHLWNLHNGYYSHGFTFTEQINGGSI